MPKEAYSASEAARALGISLETLRRWDKQGRIATTRDTGNRRVVAASEIDRLRGPASAEHVLSARNRLGATVTDVRIDGLMAKVEMLIEEPARLTAIITADAVYELGIDQGS